MVQVCGKLICPKCKCKLSTDLRCVVCGDQYENRHGVYEIISPELSGDQQIYWKVTDEILQNDDLFRQFNTENDAWRCDYESRKNEATVEAEIAQDALMRQLMEDFHGDVCDLATGQGKMLQLLIDSSNRNFNVVCTDIDSHILAWTRKSKQTRDDRVVYVATDGRYMSFADESFDFITSMAGLGNIPETEKVLAELYRILKPSGKLIIQGNYIQMDSPSYEVAKQYHVERGMVETCLMDDLRKVGFRNVISTVVGEAVWAENPYDLLPVTGDCQRFCIIQAERPVD